MQIKRDKVWTTLGWSCIGNIAGVGVVKYLDSNTDRYKTLQHFRKRELMKAGCFLMTVGLFTVYGYGNAKQHFVREKIKIVDEHSVSHSGK